MAISPAPATTFHPLRVARVVRETAEASTLVFEVPPERRDVFAYEAGQYCTFRVEIDGRPVERCYSMSSAPSVDDELSVTVKRVPGGVMSNWLNDRVAAGDVVEAMRPTGRFRLTDDPGPLVAFGAGSGITPVFSLIKTALATTDRPVRLLYANRDRASVIFADALDRLVARHPDRLRVDHHYDADDGFVTAATVQPYLDAHPDGVFYLCGPTPFMDLVEKSLQAGGVDPGRVHAERFEAAALPPPADEPEAPAGGPAQVTITLDGATRSTEHRPGTTIIQAARQAGLAPPFSCEAGNCATCMAKVTEGRADMHANNALTDDEVADGWVLTCQAVPVTPTVRVVYGYEEP